MRREGTDETSVHRNKNLKASGSLLQASSPAAGGAHAESDGQTLVRHHVDRKDAVQPHLAMPAFCGASPLLTFVLTSCIQITVSTRWMGGVGVMEMAPVTPQKITPSTGPVLTIARTSVAKIPNGACVQTKKATLLTISFTRDKFHSRFIPEIPTSQFRKEKSNPRVQHRSSWEVTDT